MRYLCIYQSFIVLTFVFDEDRVTTCYASLYAACSLLCLATAWLRNVDVAPHVCVQYTQCGDDDDDCSIVIFFLSLSRGALVSVALFSVLALLSTDHTSFPAPSIAVCVCACVFRSFFDSLIQNGWILLFLLLFFCYFILVLLKMCARVFVCVCVWVCMYAIGSTQSLNGMLDRLTYEIQVLFWSIFCVHRTAIQHNTIHIISNLLRLCACVCARG